MNTALDMEGSTVHTFDALNYVATDALPRDAEQSRRLHEPGPRLTGTDPITGRDIDDLAGKPYIVDDNVVMYFESEETRQAYRDTPIDHPFHLIDNPYEDGEAEG